MSVRVRWGRMRQLKGRNGADGSRDGESDIDSLVREEC